MTAVTVLSSCIAALAFCTVSAQATIVFEYAGNLRLTEGRHGQPRPVSVSVDAAHEEILVSDAAGSALHVMDEDGGACFVTGTIAGVSNPVDAVGTPDGGFVFLDADGEGSRTIRRLDLRGEPVDFVVESPLDGWRPDHFALAVDGNYLTVDSVLGLLVKHDADTGAVIWRRALWAGTDPDKICGRPATAPDGRIYIPVGQEHRVQILTADGLPEDSFGVVGSTPGKFAFPVDVAFGPEDTVLVLDRMRHVILVFDRDQEFITEYGYMGAAPGAFYHPVSLAFASGRAYVAQGFEGRVQVYDVISTDAETTGR
jgi:DNA-binding beta-propeller fold protein YncE